MSGCRLQLAGHVLVPLIVPNFAGCVVCKICHAQPSWYNARYVCEARLLYIWYKRRTHFNLEWVSDFGKMAFLAGKQVLPDEIKIRDLAEQISLKSAQADPKVRTCASTELIQWNLFIKSTLNREHLSNEDTVCSPNHVELCTNVPLN